MICPKCGKDVGDYKYCPDCAVPTIQIEVSTTHDISTPQVIPLNNPVVEKKPVSLNRFFSIVMALQIFTTLCFIVLTIFWWAIMDTAGISFQGALLRSITCILHLASIVICLVFSKHIKFWMLFPCMVTGILIVIGHFVLIIGNLGGIDGCGLILMWPIIVMSVVSAILIPLSKIPHKENA